MNLDRLALYPGERPSIVCPFCDTWRLWRRGMLMPHRIDQSDPSSPRCVGSGQRIQLDLSPARWRAELDEARALAARRACQARSPHTHRAHLALPLEA
ncbi:hypothetical protein F8566_05075 [Actinomadura rudentiformis]|uniref:Uncharacterized protein n=2 Tax=Actinomadura rudentiformis TaxID=359158 RepID=A0A6H9Z675_9ACTN|nr:hypothetical protein F8566_05075 [Actinomadura rudentiformis]